MNTLYVVLAILAAIVVIPMLIYIVSRVQMAAWLSAIHDHFNQKEQLDEKNNKPVP